ncbi:MAG: endonuclease [Muribaculaceae bacterium]|nr:endonuclease [Muribaculaceae bacterium]
MSKPIAVGRSSVILLTIVGIACPVLTGGAVSSDFNPAGKSGQGLADFIRRGCSPVRLCPYRELSLTVFDPFRGIEVEVREGVLPAGYSHGEAVPDSWWITEEYGDTLRRDLVNWLPLNEDVVRYRRDLPPGRIIDTPTFSGALWKAGMTTVDGIETELYSPPESWRGPLARIYFYMAVRYPSARRAPVAYMMMTGRHYPGLTGYAVDLLMEWHRDNPPTEAEKLANDLCERLQGNRNPFVDRPGLAEYLWGEHKDEAYADEGETVPLHSTYRLDDEWVYLISPHVPEGVRWSIDGKDYGTAAKVSTRQLGVGSHKLKFTSGSAIGHVLIKVIH